MNPARRTTATALVLATAGGVLTTAATTATAATSCTSPAFKREFFANTTFSGTPKKTDCDSAIDQNWGNGAPVSGVPSNNFGVRWSLTRDFGSGGPFAFSAAAQDGIRVYLDGVRKVDLWKNVSTTARKTVNVTIPSGKHTLRVDFVNWTGTANVKFTYAPRTSATVDKVRPLTPTGTAVAYDTTTGKAKLTWSRNKEMDLANYRVYRRLTGSDAWKRLATTTAVSYTDTPPATGDTYAYEVRAIDKAGNESNGSADRAVTTPDRTPPGVPSGVTVQDEQRGVVVRWTAVPGATDYLVHRRWVDDGGDNPVVQVGKVSATALSWVDTTARDNLAYEYWVTAVDAAGNKSAKSSSAYVQRTDWPPNAPTGLTARTAPLGVQLTWKPASADQNVYSYRVYRDEVLVGEQRAKDGTSHLDTYVRHAASYAYTVTAVDLQGQESAPSAAVMGTAPATGLAPAAVTGLTGQAVETTVGPEIQLTWRPNSEEDVYEYDIYRAVQVDGVWQYDKWSQVRHRDEPQLSYVHDLYFPQGETARWAVVAVDSSGNSLFGSGQDFSYVTVTEPIAEDNGDTA
ncbi:PA14 domain-containing protein [Streptomyces pharetrae]|uniref:fibronectin type III domain-containing protein n=1 Tax=Streptomyces pharetrae TaxID=291370 RepID=UPI0033455FC9